MKTKALILEVENFACSKTLEQIVTAEDSLVKGFYL